MWWVRVLSLLLAAGALVPAGALAQAPSQAQGQALLRIHRIVPRYPPSPNALAYIATGQDEAGYTAWYLSDPANAAGARAFNAYLVGQGVGGVVPGWQLLRTASMWRECAAPPFEVPPVEGWANIVETLRYVGSVVEPAIGEVEPVSVYRNDRLNACAGGAAQSTHRTVGAIDMVPMAVMDRQALMLALCRLHVEVEMGPTIGLGFYKGLRFHIDAKKYREWGPRGARGTWGCGGVVAEGAMPFGGTAVVESVPTAAPPALVTASPAPGQAPSPAMPPSGEAAPVAAAPQPVEPAPGPRGRSGTDPLAPGTAGDSLAPGG